MRFFIATITAVTALCAQTPPVPPKQAPGIPPRTTPAEYQSQGKVGELTLAAEFKGHSVATPEGSPLLSEDYVVVEVGLYGPPEARTTLSAGDFSLRVNGKKAALPSQPAGMVTGSLKDPEW